MASESFYFNPGAVEFTPFSPPPKVEPVYSTSLNPLAEAFSPVEEETKQTSKQYSRRTLLALREHCKSLPPEVKIPQHYALHKKKHQKKENKISRAPGISEVLPSSEHSFKSMVSKDTNEKTKRFRQIRATLNKLTEANFEKLCSTLVSEFEYDNETMDKLVEFVFERATAFNYPDLYAQLCKKLHKEFCDKNLKKEFRVSLIAKCEECFYKMEEPMEGDEFMDAEFKRRRRLLGNIKFIGLLYKQGMLRAQIMFECFDELIKNICDEALETCCKLFMECAQLLVKKHKDKVQEYFEKITSFRNDGRFSKRILFLVEDIFDMKEKLMVPLEPRVEVQPKRTKVKFADEKPNLPSPEPKKSVSILKSDSISPETKEAVRAAVRGFLSDLDFTTGLAELSPILSNLSSSQKRNALQQIFKFALTEYNKNEEFEEVCQLVEKLLDKGLVGKNHIQEGLALCTQQIEDIKLDSPHSPDFLRLMLNYFTPQ